MDLYKILRIRRGASQDTIRKAYRERGFAAHPDRNGDPDEFKQVHLAYKVLSDPERRRRYDETGAIEEFVDQGCGAVIELVGLTFSGVLQELVKNGRRVENENLIAHMATSFDNAAKEVQKNRDQLRTIEKALAQTCGRFSTDEDENALEAMAVSHLGGVRRQIASIDQRLDEIRQAKDFIKKYRYKFEAQAMAISTAYGRFGTATGTNSSWGL